MEALDNVCEFGLPLLGVPGDVYHGLRVTATFGNDRLWTLHCGFVLPESFTQGTSPPRAGWIVRGLKMGDVAAGNTFEVPYSG